MPALAELVAETRAPKLTERPKGMFEDLLNAKPEALYLHALEHSADFEQALPILRDMVDGDKKFSDLTLDEQKLLDLATVEFATYTPKTQRPRVPIHQQVKQEPTEPPPIPGVDVPEANPNPYWWLS